MLSICLMVLLTNTNIEDIYHTQPAPHAMVYYKIICVFSQQLSFKQFIFWQSKLYVERDFVGLLALFIVQNISVLHSSAIHQDRNSPSLH